MTRIATPLTAALVLAALSMVPVGAQEGEATLIDDLSPKFKAAQLRTRHADTAVDLEVLTTIIHEDIGQFFTPHIEGHHDSSTSNLPPPLGDHVPGFGVIVQMKTPPLRQAAVEAKQDKRQLTRWQRTRLMLQGDTVHPTDIARMFHGKKLDCVQCHVPSPELHKAAVASAPTRADLVQQLIDTLAENGQHYRGLRPTEQITITVSYDPETSQNNAADLSGFGSKNFIDHFILQQLGGSASPVAEQNEDAARPEKENHPAEESRTEKSTQEVTGDLYAKQGQPLKAIEAYRRAMDEWDRSPKDALSSSQRELVQKLLRAYTDVGHKEEAKKVAVDLLGLDQFAEALKESENAAQQRLEFLRRIYLDLTGLPPSVEDVKTFLEDQNEDAFDNVVDRLLANGKYANQLRLEHWLRSPLEQRELRNPYRDWAIKNLNDDESADPENAVQYGRDWLKAADRTRRIKVPSRVSVSATKSQLDRVGDGTISKEEFAKLVNVRIFDAADK